MHWSSPKAVLVPSSFIGGLRGSKRPAILFHHKVCYSRYTRTPVIGSSGANVSEESHGSSGSAYTRVFSRLANAIKQSIMIINCPHDGNVASMPELCHRYLLLLEGREGVCVALFWSLNPMCNAINSTGRVVKNGVLQLLWMNQLALPNVLQ